MNIKTKRVYEQAGSNDGFRILVDRLWPRGLSKEDAEIDLWLKSIAPSNELRKWFNHDHGKWPEFKRRYFSELDLNGDVVSELLSHVKRDHVSPLYSSKEQEYNNATALKEYINSMLK
ncbi:MAG: DUF488 family protein [Flavobacteriales bacterium]|nr:MAG: DUF488 family protein [Flavobacteriales bacterium]